MVDEKDLTNAKNILEERLKKESLKKLKAKIEADNKINNVAYEILPIKDILSYTNLQITPVGDIKPGQKIETFYLKGSIEISSYVYNKTSVLSVLKNVINESLLSGTDKLMGIDEKSLRVSMVIERKNNPLRIKATTEVDTRVSFDFNNNSNYYNQKLKMLVL